jgi:hypothetical protein
MQTANRETEESFFIAEILPHLAVLSSEGKSGYQNQVLRR